MPGLKRATDAVHAEGTPIFAELAPGFGTIAKASAWPRIAASPKNVVIKPEKLPPGIIVPFEVVTGMPLGSPTSSAAGRCPACGPR